MKKLYFLLFSVLGSFTSFAQEMNFDVSINTPQLQMVDPKVFDELEVAMKNFLNNQKWTDDKYEPHERINCNLQMNIKSELSSTEFTASIQIQATRPIYGSNQETVLLSHNDKDVTFSYEQYQPLEYTKNSYQNNLTSILSFYVYTIIGMDYDSFSLLGGDPYFQIAQDIVSEIPPSAKKKYKGWQNLDGNRNRFWIIDNIQNPRVRPYRQAMYDYHRQSLDIMHKDMPTALIIMTKAIETIGEVRKNMPQAMILQMFANAKSAEIIEIFKNADSKQKALVKSIMTKIDATRASEYRKIGR